MSKRVEKAKEAEGPKDPTAAKRAAALKDRLEDDGGKRTSINLLGVHVKKLERLVKKKVGKNHTAVIQKLIEDA